MKLKALMNITGIYQDRDVFPGETFEPHNDDNGQEMLDSGLAEHFNERAEAEHIYSKWDDGY